MDSSVSGEQKQEELKSKMEEDKAKKVNRVKTIVWYLFVYPFSGIFNSAKQLSNVFLGLTFICFGLNVLEKFKINLGFLTSFGNVISIIFFFILFAFLRIYSHLQSGDDVSAYRKYKGIPNANDIKKMKEVDNVNR